jgi:hypothetical protein
MRRRRGVAAAAAGAGGSGGRRPASLHIHFDIPLSAPQVALPDTTKMKLACQRRQAAPAAARRQELERCVACGREQRVQQPRHAARLVEAQLAGGAVVQRLRPVADLVPHLRSHSIESVVPVCQSHRVQHSLGSASYNISALQRQQGATVCSDGMTDASQGWHMANASH